MNLGGADYNKDYARGKVAITYLYTFSESKGYKLPFLSATDMIDKLKLNVLSATFVENLGYALNSLKESNVINESEEKELIEKAAIEIAGVWNPRFSTQTIMNQVIEMAKAWKTRYLWNGPMEGYVIPMFDAYKQVYQDTAAVVKEVATTTVATVKAVATGVTSAVTTAATILPYVPYAALGLALVVGFLYLRPKKQANPRKRCLPEGEFRREHRRVIRVLKHGTRKSRVREARRQARELR